VIAAGVPTCRAQGVHGPFTRLHQRRGSRDCAVVEEGSESTLRRSGRALRPRCIHARAGRRRQRTLCRMGISAARRGRRPNTAELVAQPPWLCLFPPPVSRHRGLQRPDRGGPSLEDLMYVDAPGSIDRWITFRCPLFRIPGLPMPEIAIGSYSSEISLPGRCSEGKAHGEARIRYSFRVVQGLPVTITVPRPPIHSLSDAAGVCPRRAHMGAFTQYMRNSVNQPKTAPEGASGNLGFRAR
jgi:hypothetical protein